MDFKTYLKLPKEVAYRIIGLLMIKSDKEELEKEAVFLDALKEWLENQDGPIPQREKTSATSMAAVAKAAGAADSRPDSTLGAASTLLPSDNLSSLKFLLEDLNGFKLARTHFNEMASKIASIPADATEAPDFEEKLLEAVRENEEWLRSSVVPDLEEIRKIKEMPSDDAQTALADAEKEYAALMKIYTDILEPFMPQKN